jgi:hypothetical protein
MLVEEHKSTCGVLHLALLEELPIVGIETIGDLAGIADLRIHGHGANPLAVQGRLTI